MVFFYFSSFILVTLALMCAGLKHNDMQSHPFCGAGGQCNEQAREQLELLQSKSIRHEERDNLLKASALKSRAISGATSGPYGIQLRCNNQVSWVSLPVQKDEVAHFLHSCMPAEATQGGSSDGSMDGVGFLLANEDHFGMPPLPIETLNRYSNRACSGYSSERKNIPPLPLRPVFFPAQHNSGEQARIHAGAEADINEMGRQIMSALKLRGWARIVVDDEAAQWRLTAHKVLKELHDMDAFRKYKTSTYIGFDQVTGRDMMQMRPGFEDMEALSWPHEVRKFHQPLAKAFAASQDVAHRVWESLVPQLGLSGCQACSTENILGKRGDRFGPSVMVGYVYKNFAPGLEHGGTAGKDDFGLLKDATGIHADSGLLTVASAASTPGLDMWNPWTGALDHPEVGLPPNEWLVFAGETLGFMTGGEVRAAIHKVPWVEGSRVSMPYFLRPHSDSMLGAPGGKPVMRASTLTGEHLDSIVRPWRTPGSEN